MGRASVGPAEIMGIKLSLFTSLQTKGTVLQVCATHANYSFVACKIFFCWLRDPCYTEPGHKKICSQMSFFFIINDLIFHYMYQHPTEVITWKYPFYGVEKSH